MNKRINSFKYAKQGIKYTFIHETNFKIHVFAAVIAILMAFFLSIETWEWILIILCITMVMVAELINTAIEQIANFVSPQKHPSIKIIKDVAAGAVFIASVAALVIGFIIFLPKLLLFFINK